MFDLKLKCIHCHTSKIKITECLQNTAYLKYFSLIQGFISLLLDGLQLLYIVTMSLSYNHLAELKGKICQ